MTKAGETRLGFARSHTEIAWVSHGLSMSGSQLGTHIRLFKVERGFWQREAFARPLKELREQNAAGTLRPRPRWIPAIKRPLWQWHWFLFSFATILHRHAAWVVLVTPSNVLPVILHFSLPLCEQGAFSAAPALSMCHAAEKIIKRQNSRIPPSVCGSLSLKDREHPPSKHAWMMLDAAAPFVVLMMLKLVQILALAWFYFPHLQHWKEKKKWGIKDTYCEFFFFVPVNHFHRESPSIRGRLCHLTENVCQNIILSCRQEHTYILDFIHSRLLFRPASTPHLPTWKGRNSAHGTGK